MYPDFALFSCEVNAKGRVAFRITGSSDGLEFVEELSVFRLSMCISDNLDQNWHYTLHLIRFECRVTSGPCISPAFAWRCGTVGTVDAACEKGKHPSSYCGTGKETRATGLGNTTLFFSLQWWRWKGRSWGWWHVTYAAGLRHTALERSVRVTLSICLQWLKIIFRCLHIFPDWSLPSTTHLCQMLF